MSSPDKFVYMANQIGKFFVAQGDAGAVDGIAAHLKKFWEPRMRAAIIAHLNAGGAGLDPKVRAAVEALRATEAVPSQSVN
jgi:formate dehydrogenase subunit delta